MAPTLNASVTAHNPETGLSETYPAGTDKADLPDWAAEGITNPDVWDASPDDVDLGPVPGSAAFGAPWVDPDAPVPSIDATQPGSVTVGGQTAGATPVGATSDRDALEAMTTTELRDYAGARGIEVSASDKKGELIDKILAG